VISLVSHELRTPIGHIKGFASSLLEEDIEFDMATWKDFVSEIDHEADRLSSLVQDLLDLSKIESGTVMLNPEPVTPRALTTQALRGVATATGGHQLVDAVKDDLPRVLADALQIERVLGNLVENAVKYSPSGSVIEIDAVPRTDAVMWSVRDHGPGVPPEYRERIFEKFVRVPTAGSRAPGTGLGLAICRGIVEAHGGRLWLETPDDGGSRFVFTVPVAS
jgi:two-component system sensor histidine kinase KdpD